MVGPVGTGEGGGLVERLGVGHAGGQRGRPRQRRVRLHWLPVLRLFPLIL